MMSTTCRRCLGSVFFFWHGQILAKWYSHDFIWAVVCGMIFDVPPKKFQVPGERPSQLVFSGAIAGHDLKRFPLLSSCNSHPLMAWSGIYDSLEVLVDQYGFNVDDILTL